MKLRKMAGFPGIFAISALGCVALSACSDDAPERQATHEAKPVKAQQHRSEWLDHKADITPAQWLASRDQETLLAETDPRVVRIAQDLDRAHAIFRESSRMIANRAVQLEVMLRELGAKETAAEILADIMSIPGEVGQTEGFGAVTQHYYILRSGHSERVQALALLKKRYGPREAEAIATP